MDLQTNEKITWCPGCGNHSIFAALKKAIESSVERKGSNLAIENVVVCYGIGCHGHMVNYLKTYGFQGLHGRPIPLAEGIKLANPNLSVISVGGDGDTFGEGLSHFINAARRNIDITVLVHDNRVFGLTTGQTSPTAPKGYISKSSPDGVIEEPVSGPLLAISSSATFVAQELAFDIPNLSSTIEKALSHRGFAYINILQQCTSFNKVNTVDWFRANTQRIKKPAVSHSEAIEQVLEMKKLPLGVIYQVEKPTYEGQISWEKKPIEFDQLRDNFV